MPSGYLNTIVLYFLQQKEMLGSEFIDEHLTYEVGKYVEAGLREDYQRDLRLV